MFGTAVVDIERGQFADVKPFHWQTDEAMATNSWCYTDGNQYRTAAERQHMRQNIQDADMEKENFFCGCVFFCFSERERQGIIKQIFKQEGKRRR